MRHWLNLMAVFSISGLWHGANWTYVIWGALNGLYLISSVVTARWRLAALRLSGLGTLPQVHKVFSIICTFHLILLSWVFFRADSTHRAISILRGIATRQEGLAFPDNRAEIAAVLLVLLVAELFLSRGHVMEKVTNLPTVVRWAFYAAAVSALMLFGQFGAEQQFIYFQF